MRTRATVFVLAFAITLIVLSKGWKPLGKPSHLDFEVKAIPAVDSIAPDFDLPVVNGSRVHLSDYRGKAVVLIFWASWCVPCRAEMPMFARAQQQYAAQGLQVIGIDLDSRAGTRAGEIARLAKELNVNYPVALGNDALAEKYGVKDLPGTFYLGRDGSVIACTRDLSNVPDIEKNVLAALKERSTR